MLKKRKKNSELCNKYCEVFPKHIRRQEVICV